MEINDLPDREFNNYKDAHQGQESDAWKSENFNKEIENIRKQKWYC